MAEWTPPGKLKPQFVGLKVLFEPLKAQAAKKWPSLQVNNQAGAQTDPKSVWWQNMRKRLKEETDVSERFAGHLESVKDGMPHVARSVHRLIAVPSTYAHSSLSHNRVLTSHTGYSVILSQNFLRNWPT